MPITYLDRSTVSDIQQRAVAALQREFADENIDIRCDGGSFTPTHLKSKITFSVRSASGEAITPEASNFPICCRQIGLLPEDQNKFFVAGGHKYQIIGISPRSWKRPLIAKSLRDGKRYKFGSIERSRLTSV